MNILATQYIALLSTRPQKVFVSTRVWEKDGQVMQDPEWLCTKEHSFQYTWDECGEPAPEGMFEMESFFSRYTSQVATSLIP